ncbi:MAG: hypothetical protein NW201_09625 [Gemmatimonadales bacterium]|nr:hypothetical protein [Gemmatimonadales bacterium]
MSVPGLGWPKLAPVVAERLAVREIDALWAFPPVKRDRNEYGTAIVSTVAGDRRRIFTARYVLAIKGTDRGRFSAEVEEVGSGPSDALPQLLDGVRRRLDDLDPPIPVPPEAWWPELAQPVAEADAAPHA